MILYRFLDKKRQRYAANEDDLAIIPMAESQKPFDQKGLHMEADYFRIENKRHNIDWDRLKKGVCSGGTLHDFRWAKTESIGIATSDE